MIGVELGRRVKVGVEKGGKVEVLTIILVCGTAVSVGIGG